MHILVAISLTVMMSGIVLGNLTMHKMLGQVKDRIADEDQIGLFWSYPGKSKRIARLHRSLYPGSPLPGRYLKSIGIVVVGLVGSMAIIVINN